MDDRPTRPKAFLRTVLALLFALLVAVAQSGCVQRRMTIRTNPPGAMVYVDDYPIGVTPVSTGFIYYGTRKVRVVKDGYKTLTQYVPIRTPWYQVFPLDFVSENVVPAEIRDERYLDFTLVPEEIVPAEHVLARGEELRQSTRGTSPFPTPVSTPPPGAWPAETIPPGRGATVPPP